MNKIWFLVTLASTVSFSQTSTGSLTGQVNDPSQSRLTQVSLRLASESTGVVASATTNSEGEYTFPLLDSGRYRLEAEAPGFQKMVYTGIVIELGRVPGSMSR